MAGKTQNDKDYKRIISAIMKGVNDEDTTTYKDSPASITNVTVSNWTPDNLKGIHGLTQLNKILGDQIGPALDNLGGSPSAATQTTDIANKYTERQNIKTTLQEIARRENEIYREKFLHIILVVLGIFLVSSQLVQKYFSLGSSGGTSGGFGFGSGNLFTGFGLGTGSGLFSRFGGLGLGRSGRSRITSMFSNNPYSLSNR